jgi:hypothetical protein
MQQSQQGTPGSRAGNWYPTNTFSAATPDAINRIEVKNSASSVVLAFRELQEKSKQIEFERMAAAGDVEELRRRLAEHKRNESLQRSRSEIRTTDEVLLVREHCEAMLEETGELQARLSRASEGAENTRRDLAYQRTRCSELNEDISRNHTETQALEYRISQLQEDVSLSDGRAGELEQRLISVHASHTTEISSEHRSKSLQTKTDRERSASMRSGVRITALQKYMEIILKVNGDLTQALKTKQLSSSRIFRIVESHTRHMAARDSLHCTATRDLMGVRSEGSPRKGSPQRSRSSDSLPKTKNKTTKTIKKKLVGPKSETNTALSKKRKASSKSVLDMDDEEFELHARRQSADSKKAAKTGSLTGKKAAAAKKIKKGEGEEKQKGAGVKANAAKAAKASVAKNHKSASVGVPGAGRGGRGQEAGRLYTDDNYEESLLSRIAELRRERARYEQQQGQEQGQGGEDGSSDEEYVSLSRVGSRASLRSSDSRLSRPSERRDRRSRSNSGDVEDSSRSSWLLKPNLNPRYHDTDLFSATGGPASEDRRQRLSLSGLRSSSAEPAARGRATRSSPGGGAPRPRPRSISNTSRSRDSGLLQTAGRLAATAAATAVAAAANAESSGKIGRIFVPSSPGQSREFNVMASVSKAARSARELNATLASRVKSLDFDGCGPQFDEIAKIDLSDMHDYLSVVKNLRESASEHYY